ncbi:MAG: hypothetical protein GF411_10890 [Candidatus Lokiarchaeota archaeon]|nr:hypothetical protein [Candidatus Lokiarchaeota archaeon]
MSHKPEKKPSVEEVTRTVKKLGRSITKIFKSSSKVLEEKLSRLESIQSCKDASLTGNEDMRLLALCRLSEYGPQALDSIELALLEDNEIIRAASVGMLMYIPEQESLKLIQKHKEDSSHIVRSVAHYAYEWLKTDMDAKPAPAPSKVKSLGISNPNESDAVEVPLKTSDDVPVKTYITDEEGTIKFSVIIINGLPEEILDVDVRVLSYPKDSLDLKSSSKELVKRIGPGGSAEVVYEFTKKAEAIEGEFISSVTFIDQTGERIASKTGNRLVRSFYSQIEPKKSTKEDYHELKNKMKHWSREHVVQEDPKTIFEQIQVLMKNKNLYIINSEGSNRENMFMGVVTGMGRGKYIGARIAITITILGRENEDLSKIRIDVISEDGTFINTAASEMYTSIQAVVAGDILLDME